MELEDLATEAFRRSNFELASDLIDRLLEKQGHNIEFLLMKGDSLANMGRLNEALSVYSHAFRMGDISSDKLHGFVNALVKNLSQNAGRDISKDLGKFSCSVCRGLLSKPTTLLCGHTFCKTCIEHQSKRSCVICKFPYSSNGSKCKKLTLNVTLSDLILKYFPHEVKSQEIKSAGNELFKLGRHSEAMEKYSLAIKTAPGDHLCLSNRSHTYNVQGLYSEALQDATKVCQMRPDWAKGFYRKGTALVGLGRQEEGLEAFSRCLTLDPSFHSAKVSLTKVLHTLLQPVDASSVKANEMQRSPSLSKLYLNEAVDDGLEEVNRVEELSGRMGPGEEREDGKRQESPIKHNVNTGTTLDRRKFSPVERKYTKKRLPSQTDEQIHPFTDGSSPDAKNQSKRFKKCPLSMLEKKGCGEKEQIVKPGPGYTIPTDMIEKTDFECSLCLRLFYQPTTTPCGHTFCRGCLDRCLDYSQSCPLCKQSLSEYQAVNRDKKVTYILQELMESFLSSDYAERQQIHRKELDQVASHAFQDGGTIPVFVCTIALPTIPCPLHVFEPRYRLMIRQAMESGARQFGMCISDDENEFAEYGCMLEINQLEYLPDGRCVLGTVGGRRFKVLERGMRDGYNTAKVEFLKDTIAEGEVGSELRALNNSVYQQARTWFVNLPIYHQTRIVDHFGPMPQQASDPQASFNGPQWHWWLLAILPLHPRVQLSILSKTSLKERLQVLQRSLTRMTNIPS
ncbi:LON peptidase N-terminal domain and RING finger protein 3-like [Lytechinus variegatus]|uniref:LON peptidase N-terminal domain and RING finger protein 3-like n=1 Tax=Lytechinus variegatus TaxID=7654 RepID=UPI001BB27EE2|nr:LON peptidase N-terminal domain and RING finger protein 3-like [Lytechinus variegatus]